jgi:hypothetical protein
MTQSFTVLIDGKPYRWRDILALRRDQLAAVKKAEQLPLFADLPADHRPAYARTAAGRYQQPSLF